MRCAGCADLGRRRQVIDQRRFWRRLNSEDLHKVALADAKRAAGWSILNSLWEALLSGEFWRVSPVKTASHKVLREAYPIRAF